MDKSVGKRVVRLRQDRDWSQIRLAQEAGVTPNTIRGLEKGTLNTRWPKLQKIARALGTTPEQLLSGDEKIEAADPMLEGLRREDLRIARLYHDAETPQRQLAHRVLTTEEPEDVIELAARIARLPAPVVVELKAVIGLVEADPKRTLSSFHDATTKKP